jgi:putative phage-type endonuclease
MIIKNIEQRTPEWFALRAGNISASNIKCIKAGKDTATRNNYLVDLAIERLTGEALQQESFSNEAIERGIEMEPIARAAYEAATGVFVEQVTLAQHDTIQRFVASPDGLVGKDGLVEIKCPNKTTHINYLLKNEPPKQYIEQMIAQCACTGRKWVDFVSFDDRMPEGLELFIVRFTPTIAQILEIEELVVDFSNEVDAMVNLLKQKGKQ